MELECLYVQTPRPESWGLGNRPVRGVAEHQSTCEMKGGVLFVCQGVNFGFVFCHPIPCSSHGKEAACNAGDRGLIPDSGRSSGEGNGNPLQYSCPESPMDRGPWRATIHGVTKSRT